MAVNKGGNSMIRECEKRIRQGDCELHNRLSAGGRKGGLKKGKKGFAVSSQKIKGGRR